MFKKLAVISAALVASFLVMPGMSLAVKDHSQKPTLAWTKDIPSRAPVVHGMAYESAIYAGGFYMDPGTNTPLWRIEKRSEATGDLVPTFGTAGAAVASVIGEVMAFGANGPYLFAAGIDLGAGELDYQWRIEKRETASGALVASFGTNGVVMSNPSDTPDVLSDIVLNPSDNSFYAVGYDYDSGEFPEIRIEKRDMTSGGLIAGFGTNGIVTENPTGGGIVFTAAVDSSGLYVGGFDGGGVGGEYRWRIEKRELGSGSLVAGFGTGGVVAEHFSAGADGGDLVTDLSVNDSALYAVGVTGSGSDSARAWRIEKRDKTTGGLATGFGTAGAISETFDSGATPSSIVLDSTGLYVGGYIGEIQIVAGFSVNQKSGFEMKYAPIFPINNIDEDPGDFYWRVEKRNFESGALDSNFGTDGTYIYNPNSSDSDVDEIFEISIDENSLYIFGMSNPTPNNYSWLIQRLQFPEAAEVVVAATIAPETLPETGAGTMTNPDNLPVIAIGLFILLLAGSALRNRSRSHA